MFIGLFKNNNPSNYIILPVIAAALWTNSFITQNSEDSIGSPLFELMFEFLNTYPLLSTLLSFVLVVSEAFLLNFLVNKNDVVSKPNFLPALFYILFMSMDNALLELHPLVLSNLFILLFFNEFTESYRKDDVFANVFNAGAFFSLATFFYPPVFTLLPILVIGLIIFRPFYWREWIICLIGIVTPYLFIGTYCFWNDSLNILWNSNFLYSANKPAPTYSSSLISLISMIVFTVFLSSKIIIRNVSGSSQKKIKSTLLFIWILFLAILPIIKAPSYDIKYLSLLCIPFSVFCSEYFINTKKNWWSEFLFSLIFITLIVNLLSIYF